MPNVEVPGVGVVEFPDSMPPAEIAAAAKKLHTEGSIPPQSERELFDSLVRQGKKEGAQSGIGKFLMPAVGGGMGASQGAAIGANLGQLGGPYAPVTIPAGALIGGMIGAGAGTAGMEAGRQSLAEEQINPQELIRQGSIAAATEPFGMILGPGIKGAKAIKGAGGLGAASKKFLGGFTQELEERFPGAMNVVEQVGVGTRGVKQINAQLTPVINQHKALVRAAATSGVRARPNDIMQPVVDVIRQLDEAGSPMADAMRKRAYNFFRALGSDSAELPATRVLKVKQVAQGKTDALYRQQAIRRAAGKVVKNVGGKTAELNFQEALAKGAQQWLETNVPGSAELNQTTRSLMGAREALLSPSSRTARRQTARFVTAATAASLPGDIMPRVGAGALGYGLGHMAEPMITPALGMGLEALQNPFVQQGIRQMPRAVGLGFNQALRDQ